MAGRRARQGGGPLPFVRATCATEKAAVEEGTSDAVDEAVKMASVKDAVLGPVEESPLNSAAAPVGVRLLRPVSTAPLVRPVSTASPVLHAAGSSSSAAAVPVGHSVKPCSVRPVATSPAPVEGPSCGIAGVSTGLFAAAKRHMATARAKEAEAAARAEARAVKADAFVAKGCASGSASSCTAPSVPGPRLEHLVCFVRNAKYQSELKMMEEVCAQQAREVEEVSLARGAELLRLNAQVTLLRSRLCYPPPGTDGDLPLAPLPTAADLGASEQEGVAEGSAEARAQDALRRLKVEFKVVRQQVQRQELELREAAARANEAEAVRATLEAQSQEWRSPPEGSGPRRLPASAPLT
eukprot:TRINITY_DN14953_c0_g1_i4.p1 TRINITY_DN14953_c0_g1~~TRINITY_DN14953_c0_g1_i4.p1  ORF type:complete len:377 (+),score=76.63 TRINITY_DN14953_c0_g1_i4:73-1131(+)